MERRLFLILLLLLSAYGGSALTILGQQVELLQINGAMHQEYVATFICSGTDFDNTVNFFIQSDTGQVHSMGVTCDRPSRIYNAQFVGVLPKSGSLVQSYIGNVMSTQTFSPANETGSSSDIPGSTFRDPTVRNLLEQNQEQLLHGKVAPSRLCWINENKVRDGDTDDTCPGYALVQVTSPDGTLTEWVGDSSVSGIAVAAMCMQYFVLHGDPTRYISCAQGKKYSDVIAMRDSADAQLRAMRDMMDSSRRLINISDIALSDLQNFTSQVYNFYAITNTTIDGLNTAFEALRERQRAEQNLIEGEIGKTSANIATNADLIASFSSELATLINATSTAQDQISKNLVDAFNRAIAVAKEAQSLLSRTSVADIKMIYNAQTWLIELNQQLLKLHTLEDEIRMHSVQLHKAIDAKKRLANLQGRTWTVFGYDEGRKPAANFADLGPWLSTVVVRDTFMRHVLERSSQYIGVMTEIVFTCDSMYMTTRAPQAPTSKVLIDIVGDVGCDWTFSDPEITNRCRCAMNVVEKKCQLKDRTAQTVNAFMNPSDPTLIDNSTGCIQLSVDFWPQNQGGLDGRVMRGFDDQAALWSNITSRGVPIADSSYKLYENLFSDLSYTMQYKPFLNDSSRATLMRAIDPSDIENDLPNLAFMYYRVGASLWRVPYENMDEYNDQIFGQLPSSTSQEPVGFVKTYYGTMTNGWKLSVMMFSDEFLVASTLTPIETVTSATITADGNSTSASDIILQNPKQHLLPAADWIVWDPARGLSKWYDVPDDAMLYGPSRSMAHMLTYNLATSRNNFTINDFMDLQSDSFEPIYADHIAEPYEVELDSNSSSPAYLQCVGRAFISGGSQCALRREFLVLPQPGLFEDHQVPGTFVLQDRTPTYTFRARVPEGRIIFDQSAGCPIGRVLATQYNQATLMLYNPEAYQTVVRLSRYGLVNSNACPEVRQMSLLPRISTPIRYSSCSSETTSFVTIEYQNETLGWTTCPSSFNLTFDGATLMALDTPMSANFSVLVSQYVVSTLVDFITEKRQQLLNMSLESVYAERSTQPDLGLRYDQVVVGNTTAQTERLNALVRASQQAARDAFFNATAFDNANFAYRAALDAILNRVDAALAQQRDKLAAVREANDKSRVSLSALRIIRELRREDFNNWLDATVVWAEAITNYISGLIFAEGKTDLSVQIRPSRKSTFWKSFGDLALDVGADAAELAAKGIHALANAAGGGAKDLLDGILGPLKSIIMFLFIVILIVAFVAVVFKVCIPCCKTAAGPLKHLKIKARVRPELMDMILDAERLLAKLESGIEEVPLIPRPTAATGIGAVGERF